MPTCSYRALVRACRALGLEPVKCTNGTKWIGISPMTRRPVLLVIHAHALGRDIPDGLFRRYLAQLGFTGIDHFRQWSKEQRLEVQA